MKKWAPLIQYVPKTQISAQTILSGVWQARSKYDEIKTKLVKFRTHGHRYSAWTAVENKRGRQTTVQDTNYPNELPATGINVHRLQFNVFSGVGGDQSGRILVGCYGKRVELHLATLMFEKKNNYNVKTAWIVPRRPMITERLKTTEEGSQVFSATEFVPTQTVPLRVLAPSRCRPPIARAGVEWRGQRARNNLSPENRFSRSPPLPFYPESIWIDHDVARAPTPATMRQ